MSELHIFSLILGLLGGIIIGYFLGRILLKRFLEANSSADPRILDFQNQIENLSSRLQAESEENKMNLSEVAALNEKIRSSEKEINTIKSFYQEKENELKRNFEESRKRFSDEFKVLADRIFEDKSERFTKQNKENLELFLNPLKDKLKSFEDKVEKTYQTETKERISLQKEIEHLVKLNQQLSQDANNLVTALKGESKTQGDWGEVQLEIILEKAGLIKDIHYSTQNSYKDEEGNLKRPDLIIQLPESKNLIVDSKVSLTAYESYVSSEDPADKEAALKRHIDSIKAHIKSLQAKKYPELYQIQTPDYVLMFVPIEPALSLAIQTDQKMFLDALEKNVVLVSNSTLLATMKTVSFIWKQEDQKKNVIEIARQGAALYDKFVGFTEDLLRIGKQLNSAKDQYDSAMNKLSTGKDNLIRKSEKLKDLGLKTQKKLNDKLLERADEKEIE